MMQFISQAFILPWRSWWAAGFLSDQANMDMLRNPRKPDYFQFTTLYDDRIGLSIFWRKQKKQFLSTL